MLPTIATGNVGSALAGEYEVANSCRFESTSNDNLTLTPSSTGNRSKFTISFWIKRAKLGGSDPQRIFSVDTGSTTQEAFVMFETDDSFRLFSKYDGSNIDINYDTNRVFRDTSAWYHMVWRVDTTESTESNRVRLYVNGVEETSFASQTEPSQNDITRFNEASRILRIGERSNGNDDISCYLAEVVMLDGQALDPTSFGEFDSDTNIWKPIDVSGLTFGTNGFYLDFENSGSLGADVSGNGNNFTVNNLTSIDQSTDTCTNNFATMNPLDKTPIGTSLTYSHGNLVITASSGSDWTTRYSLSNFVVSSGKWYVECQVGSIGTNQWYVGVIKNRQTATFNSSLGFLSNGVGYGHYAADGRIINNGSDLSTGSSFTTNDIIGIALDLDNGTLNFYKNGSANGSQVTSLDTTAEWQFVSNSYSNAAWNWNFGGTQSFTISSGNSDGNGIGNFEYSVPSGYFALCTSNLAEHG